MRWRLFAGVTLVVLIAVLGLSRATAKTLTESATSTDPGARSGDDARETGGFGVYEEKTRGPEEGSEAHEKKTGVYEGRRESAGPPGAETGTDLLVGAALSQALVGAFLAGLAWYAEIPAAALGIDDPAGAVLPGLALGVALYGANEAGVWLADRAGIESDETLRELLAPETAGGWVLLLFVVLPLVAVVEEFLFRGALVGALAVGFPVSPWLLAALSSVAFGLGHGLQGPGGVAVTGALGFVLAAAFVLTGSLWVVVVAHYVVNALEFLVHEGPPAGLEHRR